MSTGGRMLSAMEVHCFEDAELSSEFGSRAPVYERMYDSNVIAFVSKPMPVVNELYAAEKAHIAKAVASRQTEFIVLHVGQVVLSGVLVTLVACVQQLFLLTNV